MNSKPIIFSAPMIHALLDGRKTQTRRIVREPMQTALRRDDPNGEIDGGELWRRRCPYGKPGDLLWVRETCRAKEHTDAEARKDTFGVADRLGWEMPAFGLGGVLFEADGRFEPMKNTREASEAWLDLYHYGGKKPGRDLRGKTVPPIHMPRWASRLTLRITDVRVQRLSDMSSLDAKAEGAMHWAMADGFHASFAELWDHLHGRGAYATDPWVWALTFEVIKSNVDDVLRTKEAA